MRVDTDVIIIGSGGGGAVAAKELGESGLQVLVLEAGPWYGNKQWPNPNQERGGTSSSHTNDLDVILYKKLFNKLENNMNDPITGRFRWGASDRGRPPWFRHVPQGGFVIQGAGVGGTTQHYESNSPRAFPSAVDHKWPISYQELIPYYEKVEATLPVNFAPITSKEELFYYAAKKAGWSLIPTLDVTSPGYRPQPNAILPPNPNLTNPKYSLEQLSNMEGCTLSGHCIHGCPHGPSMEKIAKRSTNVSYVPLALKTGNVTIRPNTFTTKVLTENDPVEGIRAIGVQFRDTWTGETGELYASVVVMAAGCIETPRLWLNSGLPNNPWVGRGLTNHFFDRVVGIFDENILMSILGTPDTNQFVGHTSGARLDYPGLGSIQVAGLSPGLLALLDYGTSESKFSFLHDLESEGPTQIYGSKLKEIMADYRRMLGLLILTDDDVDWRNGVTLDPFIRDEHGPVPLIRYFPTKETSEKRNKLAKIAADLLLKAGAKKIIRSDVSPGIFIHLESTMRMGFVTDTNCEAFQVKRLFIADNSVHYNSIGGPNPTLTTQALVTRAAEKLVQKYFG
jgi:choline dehydrogenase-like flavoprotein